MSDFDAIADEYDAARPGYPDGLYDALEPLQGALVLEGGAGTGIATRTLLARGARVVPFDPGPEVLRRAVRRTPGLQAVVADGAAMPFRDGCADLACFAQSWHWLDEGRRAAEAARVLRPDGRWAAWWSHARADGDPWFRAYWEVLERATDAKRIHRDVDWGERLQREGSFDVGERVVIRWERHVSLADWLTEERSKTYVARLQGPERAALLNSIEQLIRERFPDGRMRVAYETWLWIARPVPAQTGDLERGS